MPVMDGFEATKYIREVLQLDILIYELTGESEEYFQQQIVEAGFDGSYTKPFLKSKLEELLNEYVSSKQTSC